MFKEETKPEIDATETNGFYIFDVSYNQNGKLLNIKLEENC